MKANSWIWILPLIVGLHAQAQQAKEIKVNDVPVVYRYVPNGLVSAYVVFYGGVANYDSTEAGIEYTAIHTAYESGIPGLPGDQMQDLFAELGIMVGPIAQRHYAGFSITAPAEYIDTAISIIGKLLTNAIFDEKSYQKVIQRQKAIINNEWSNPDDALRIWSITHMFKGYDYEKYHKGTNSSLANLTYQKVKDYYTNRLVDKSRAFVVVVGDVKENRIQNWSLFKILPARNMKVKFNLPDRIQFDTSELFTLHREGMATNYIRGIVGAPKLNTSDEVPYRLAFEILDDKMFVEIRTKRNLSYAPAAFYTTVMKTPYAILYVSSTLPDSAASVMWRTVKNVIENGFSEKEFRNTKELMRTRFYLQLEGNASMAGAYVRHEMIAGDWQRADKYSDWIKQTTLEQVNGALRKYARGIRWYYLGDTTQIKNKQVYHRILQ
ncbi:MAG: insulinase family protein [Chlorobi bacterium]|nr:insulinase family protein [Chlorobiota bacterium]